MLPQQIESGPVKTKGPADPAKKCTIKKYPPTTKPPTQKPSEKKPQKKETLRKKRHSTPTEQQRTPSVMQATSWHI
jgi:hypothetical protein